MSCARGRHCAFLSYPASSAGSDALIERTAQLLLRQHGENPQHQPLGQQGEVTFGATRAAPPHIRAKGCPRTTPATPHPPAPLCSGQDTEPNPKKFFAGDRVWLGFSPPSRRGGGALTGEGPASHGARPVHLIITMIKWIRTSRLSMKMYLSPRGGGGALRGRGRILGALAGQGARHSCSRSRTAWCLSLVFGERVVAAFNLRQCSN